MATCPRCRGYLTDSHECPRKPLRTAVEIGLVGLIGGFTGLVVVTLFQPGGQFTEIDLVSVVAGALAAVGLNRTLRG